jgi:hypothetical protein
MKLSQRQANLEFHIVQVKHQILRKSRFSVIETRFTGYASLSDGQTGTCRAGYTFAGDSRQEVIFQKNLVAPYEDNYNMIAGVGVESFSRCGGTTAILNVNSEIRITPISTPYPGTMTVSAPWTVGVEWRRCDPASLED